MSRRAQTDVNAFDKLFISEKYIIQETKDHKKKFFKLCEPQERTELKFMIDNEPNFISLNIDEIKHEMFKAFGEERIKQIINYSSSDFIVAKIAKTDYTEIELYIIELGPHGHEKIRLKANGTMNLFLYLYILYMQKKYPEIKESLIKYSVLHYNPKDSNRKSPSNKVYPTIEDNYRYFRSNSSTIRIADLSEGLKELKINLKDCVCI